LDESVHVGHKLDDFVHILDTSWSIPSMLDTSWTISSINGTVGTTLPHAVSTCARISIQSGLYMRSYFMMILALCCHIRGLRCGRGCTVRVQNRHCGFSQPHEKPQRLQLYGGRGGTILLNAVSTCARIRIQSGLYMRSYFMIILALCCHIRGLRCGRSCTIRVINRRCGFSQPHEKPQRLQLYVSRILKQSPDQATLQGGCRISKPLCKVSAYYVGVPVHGVNPVPVTAAHYIRLLMRHPPFRFKPFPKLGGGINPPPIPHSNFITQLGQNAVENAVSKCGR
jgi:hypothetical protein